MKYNSGNNWASNLNIRQMGSWGQFAISSTFYSLKCMTKGPSTVANVRVK